MNNSSKTDEEWKTEEVWKKKLTPEQFEVLRKRGTERAFTGKYLNNKEKGMYVCGACGSKIFPSDVKFDSNTGWPSFKEALPNSVDLEIDLSHKIRRIEVKCKKCGSHLGHVFDDGPAPTRKRYCINSCALNFKK